MRTPETQQALDQIAHCIKEDEYTRDGLNEAIRHIRANGTGHDICTAAAHLECGVKNSRIGSNAAGDKGDKKEQKRLWAFCETFDKKAWALRSLEKKVKRREARATA